MKISLLLLVVSISGRKRPSSVDDCYDKDYFKSDGRLLPKDQCLRAVRRAKVKINVATDWRCEPFSECPKSKQDCRKFEFVDDMFGVISRRDCIKWVKANKKLIRKGKKSKFKDSTSSSSSITRSEMKRRKRFKAKLCKDKKTPNIVKIKNKCGRKGKNKRKWKVEPLIVSPPITSPTLSQIFETTAPVTKPPPTTYSTLSVTIPPLPRLVTFPVTERMTVPPLPRLETTPMMELKAATEIRPFTVDLDMLELSYGDFIMKKFIYNDLTWTEAKDACDSINGLLPYFNTITDLEVIKNSLLKMTTIGKKFGEHIWLGYQKKYPTQKQTMYNVYTNVPAMIQPYQKDEFENCAAYSPKYKSHSFFDVQCNQRNRQSHSTYISICLVPEDSVGTNL